MKEEKKFSVLLQKGFLRLRYFNPAQLGLMLLLGNVLYFSYGLYVQQDISTKTPPLELSKNHNIQVIK